MPVVSHSIIDPWPSLVLLVNPKVSMAPSARFSTFSSIPRSVDSSSTPIRPASLSPISLAYAHLSLVVPMLSTSTPALYALPLKKGNLNIANCSSFVYPAAVPRLISAPVGVSPT